MNILLFGVSNIGKSVIGERMAGLLNWAFYDLDDEVKKDQNTTLEKFVSTGTLSERDAVRCRILKNLVGRNENKVIAVTPLSYLNDIRYLFSSPDVISIELKDSVENIFERLVFSDENDIIYKDDDYKKQHMNYYLREIQANLEWYGSVFSDIKNKFDIAGMTPEDAAVKMMEQFHLCRE